MSFFIVLVLIPFSLASANECASHSNCKECIVTHGCVFAEDFEDLSFCTSESDIQNLEIKSVTHTVDLCDSFTTNTLAIKEITGLAETKDKEVNGNEKYVAKQTHPPPVEISSFSDEAHQQPTVIPDIAPTEVPTLSKKVRETTAEPSSETQAFLKEETPSEPTVISPIEDSVLEATINEPSVEHNQSTEIAIDVTSSRPEITQKEAYCSKDFRESKAERLGRSLCRSFKLLKRQIQMDVKYRHMEIWNKGNPYANRPNECRLLVWKRTNCRKQAHST